MYEWLVSQMDVGGILGLVFGGVGLIFLLILGRILWEIRHLRMISSHNKENEGDTQAQNAVALADKGAFVDKAESQGQIKTRRLTLCDSVTIDEERRLVLVRRDDVEHLIMVGSSGDMVIEHNIPVEEHALATVSMLAISQAENDGRNDDFSSIPPPFIALNEEETPTTTNESSLEEISANQQQLDDQPVQQADIAESETVKDGRAEHEDLALSFDQLSQALSNELADSARDNIIVPMEEQNLALHRPLPLKGAMASLFPGRMDKQEPLVDQASSSLNASANSQENKRSDRLPEPPVASYFAGQSKRAEQGHAEQGRDPVSSLIEGQIQTPPQTSSTVFVRPKVENRILPLNPFFHATSSIAQPDPVPPLAQAPIPPEAAASLAPQPSVQTVPQIAGNDDQSGVTENTARIQSPSSPAPPEDSGIVINSFLGLPLRQLTKIDSNHGRAGSTPSLSASLVQTHLQPTSHSSLLPLKKTHS